MCHAWDKYCKLYNLEIIFNAKAFESFISLLLKACLFYLAANTVRNRDGHRAGFPGPAIRNPGFFDPARNGSGLTRRFLTRDPEFFESKTRAQPGPGIFLKINPDPARVGMSQPGPALGFVKNFQEG